jgi:hypothetical protein
VLLLIGEKENQFLMFICCLNYLFLMIVCLVGSNSCDCSGDHDLIIPFLGTQAWIRSLNFSIIDDEGVAPPWPGRWVKSYAYIPLSLSLCVFFFNWGFIPLTPPGIFPKWGSARVPRFEPRPAGSHWEHLPTDLRSVPPLCVCVIRQSVALYLFKRKKMHR